MILGVVLTVMTLCAAALVAVPLLRANRQNRSRAAHEIEIYRDQLEEIDRDLDRNLISETEAEAARTEIGRRLLAIHPPDTDEAARSVGRAPVAAAVVAICVTGLAAGLYLNYGKPDLPGRPAAAVAAAEAEKTGDLRNQVVALADALEKEPANIGNWIALGDTLTAMKRHQRAAVAYTQAMRLVPANAGFASRAGEALVLAANGQVTPDAAAAFREALRRDPGDPRGQYYLGLADRQGGRLRAALDRWLALEAASPPDAPWLKFLAPRIARTATELGLDSASLAELRRNPPAPPTNGILPGGPTREQMDAARDMSAEDRQAMIRSMVDRLAEKLKDNPDDVAGWQRLARARKVLGDRDAARDALGRVAALRPDDVPSQVAYADAIVDAAEPNPPETGELEPVVDRILARDPDNPRALWLSGALALSSGDRDTARKRWTRLLDFVDPNSPQYVELKNQLNALDGK